MSSTRLSRGAARDRAREVLAAMTEAEDKCITEAALADPEAQLLGEERLARMRPASPIEAADLKRRLRGRPRAPAAKRLVSLRPDPDVLAHFRATGPGWQSRISAVLREHVSAN